MLLFLFFFIYFFKFNVTDKYNKKKLRIKNLSIFLDKKIPVLIFLKIYFINCLFPVILIANFVLKSRENICF